MEGTGTVRWTVRTAPWYEGSEASTNCDWNTQLSSQLEQHHRRHIEIAEDPYPKDKIQRYMCNVCKYMYIIFSIPLTELYPIRYIMTGLPASSLIWKFSEAFGQRCET